MHHALCTSELEFDCYCYAQPPARIRRALDDADAATMLAAVRVQLARVQLARWFELRDIAFRQAHARLSHVWRNFLQRKEHRYGPQPQLKRQRHASLRSLPRPLVALLCNDEAGSTQCYNVFMEGRRCGAKLWTLMGTYGTGVLLLAPPVLNLARLYHCSEDAFAALETQLALMPRFADFVTAVSAAYETRLAAPPTLTPAAVARLPAVKLLRLFANEGSDGALRCASGIGEHTPQNLRSPLSPLLLAEVNATSVCSLSLA
jgi:hypothetical protein